MCPRKFCLSGTHLFRPWLFSLEYFCISSFISKFAPSFACVKGEEKMEVKQNSLRAWVLAARPKTLSAALVPVVVACALAVKTGTFDGRPALLCVVFAAFMQIAANFINDLYDFLRGTDREDRLGPERACAQGWISAKAMKWGIAATVVPACAFGLLLLHFGGLWLIAIGVACVVFAFLYTLLLSYCGLGDVLVYLFFGFVPVVGTYYVQAHAFDAPVWWLSAACGLAVDNLLVVNNYRDREQDKQSGKRTIIVVFGECFGRYFYLLQGVAACLCVAALAVINKSFVWCGVLPLFYLLPHYAAWRKLSALRSGRALNGVLGATSRNMLLFGLLTAVAVMLG